MRRYQAPFNPHKHAAHFWRGVAICFMLTSTLLAVGMLLMSNRVDPARLVYEVCNESRLSPTIDERGCGDLQDQLHMEFLCDQNNIDPANHCWVERKD